MAESDLRVLVIEDNPPDGDLLAEMLATDGNSFHVERVECLAQAESYLNQQPAVDVILLDLGLPDGAGLASLERVACVASHQPIIVLTGLEDEALGVEAVRKGAQDYLVKGQISSRMLVRIVRHAIERKRLEESLRQLRDLAERRAAEAQAASTAKTQFLANVSHELRTPMNVILGMIKLALRQGLNSTTKDYLDTARESADTLLALLNDLLDSAKIESGKLELEAAPFRLRRILDQITRGLFVRASEKGLQFICRMPDDLPEAVVGDEVRLRQVLVNLAGNAIKFTERGEVELSVRAISLTNKEVRLEFSVRDTGIGMSPSDLERVFKPFTQADASTARRFGGTGLGLSISANLAALMDGRIWAESETGQGSTFHFTVSLPLATELPTEAEAASAASAAASTALRILLVEDNPANQKFAAYLLRDRGHVVEIAGDGRQALEMTRGNRYDAILMDVQLPGMDGLATTAAIRAGSPKESRVPIIAMTAHAMSSDRERCLAAGMDGYLSKPIDAGEMFAAIESLGAGASVAQTDVSPLVSDQVAMAGGLSDVFDANMAMERCYGSRETLQEMIDFLFQEADLLFPQIHAALQRGDFRELGRLGHRFKGTLIYLGAQPATQAAVSLERCESSSKDEARNIVHELQRQVASLKLALAAYRTANLQGTPSHPAT